jgi:protein-disulfide isomerase
VESTTRTRALKAGIIGAVALLLIAIGDARAAPTKTEQSEMNDLKEEVSRLRAEIEGMRQELRQFMQRVAGEPPPIQHASVTTTGGEALGNKEAPLTLVEFSDYQCPFCRRFFEQTFPRIKTQYVDTGKLRYVFRDFPLDQIHPQARVAAIAAHCAGDQGKYWEVHDAFFKNQQALRAEDLKSYAQKLGLKADVFNDCLDKQKYGRRVQANEDDGLKAGVQGTPAFFLGKSGKDGTIDATLISGARPYEDFQREIDKQLAEKRTP